MPLKTFSIENANELVPKFSKIFERIDMIKTQAQGKHIITKELFDMWKEVEMLLEDINETGAILKDANIGLVDFPHIINGDIVLLCWKRGEKEIKHWHPVNKNGDRRPLAALDVAVK